MQAQRYSSGLTARQWQRLAPLLVVRRTSKWTLQAVVNGIFYVLKNGCVWPDVPADLESIKKCGAVGLSSHLHRSRWL